VQISTGKRSGPGSAPGILVIWTESAAAASLMRCLAAAAFAAAARDWIVRSEQDQQRITNGTV